MRENPGYPCFEGRILQANACFAELDKLDEDGLKDCLKAVRPSSSTTPEELRRFAQQWVYVLCRLAARCVPLPVRGAPWDAGESVGTIRFCPLAPGDLLPRQGQEDLFFPVRPRASGTRGVPDSDYRLFLVMDCKSSDTGTKNCGQCSGVPDCGGTGDCALGAFGASAIGFLHSDYIAFPTEDALTIDLGAMEGYKPYLAWYIDHVLVNYKRAMENLRALCGEAPRDLPAATLELLDGEFDFSQRPAAMTQMPHM